MEFCESAELVHVEVLGGSAVKPHNVWQGPGQLAGPCLGQGPRIGEKGTPSKKGKGRSMVHSARLEHQSDKGTATTVQGGLARI